MRISNNIWIDAYLALEDNDPVVNSFINLGTLTDQDLEINDNDIPLCIKPFEKFVCATYDKKGATSLPALRWDLFRTRNLEGEKLPPTRASFIPHMQRAWLCKKQLVMHSFVQMLCRLV